MSRRHHTKRFHNKHSFRKPSVFQRLNWFCRNHPIISAGGSILIGIILLRLSFIDILFGNSLSEFRMWILFLSFIFFIVGIIAFRIWLRRNVPNIFTKHDINWRNRQLYSTCQNNKVQSFFCCFFVSAAFYSHLFSCIVVVYFVSFHYCSCTFQFFEVVY